MTKTLKNILKYTLLVVTIMLLLINTVFTIATNHIKYFHTYLAQQISHTIKGTYSFDDTKIKWNRFTRDFHLETYNTQIYDTLFSQHNRRLMRIGTMETNVSFWSVLSANIEISDFKMKDVELNLFVDSSGYTNSYLLQSEEDKEKLKDTTRKSKNININHLYLENVKVAINQIHSNKSIEFTIDSMNGTVKQTSEKVEVNFETHAFIEKLGFNMTKGAFLEKQHIHIPYTTLLFDKILKRLVFEKSPVIVDDQTLYLSMLFDFYEKPGTYDVTINAPTIDYPKALQFVNQHLRKNFSLINFERPLAVNVQLSGILKPKYNPLVIANFHTDSNYMTSDYGNIKNMTIAGSFTNNFDSSERNSDKNSRIHITQLSGLYNENIPFYSDTIYVYNLKDPYIDVEINSKAPVESINSFIGQAMDLKNGQADIKLHYKGHIAKNKITDRSIHGYIKINRANFVYYPRKWTLNNINVNAEFQGKDLILKNISAQKGESKIHIDGNAENFLNAYFDNPELIKIQLNLSSPLLDMKDMSAFTTHNTTVKTTSQKSTSSQPKKIKEINDRVDNLLALGSLNLNLNIKEIKNDNFLSYNNKINLDFLSDKIRINKAQLDHAGGHIELNGVVHQTERNNPFSITGSIKEVDVSHFFHAMNNFNMQSLSSENINGLLSSDFLVNGRFTDNGSLLKNSLSGHLNFDLSDGALINFGPLKEIGKYVFRSRNLDSITFKRIHNNFVFENGQVLIFPMSIQSTLLSIDLQGNYAFDRGTDIAIHIPIINQKNRSQLFSNSKFLSLNLRAQDDENGKIKIGWDPKQKGIKNTKGFDFRQPENSSTK